MAEEKEPEEELSSSDDDDDEEEQEEATVSSGKSKRRGKVRVAGEEEEEITEKNKRDEARKNEMKEVLEEVAKKPKADLKAPPKKRRRQCGPFYPICRFFNCCIRIPIHEAVLEANSSQVRRNLSKFNGKKQGSAEQNVRDEKGRTPLDVALKEEREDIADLMLSFGNHINANIKDRQGFSLLHTAVQLEQVNSIGKFEQRGVEVDAVDETGMTPLMLACWIGNETIVDMLLDMNANPEKKDQCKWTPMHYAACGGSVECLELLTEQAVNHRKKDKYGLRPLDWAKYMQQGEAEAFLETYKPSLSEY